MIPQSSIDEWRAVAPWSTDLQVEQDLVVARAVAELFEDESMRERVAMRGGTVLNKFYFGGGGRYSEDSVPRKHGGRECNKQTNRSA